MESDDFHKNLSLRVLWHGVCSCAVHKVVLVKPRTFDLFWVQPWLVSHLGRFFEGFLAILVPFPTCPAEHSSIERLIFLSKNIPGLDHVEVYQSSTKWFLLQALSV